MLEIAFKIFELNEKKTYENPGVLRRKKHTKTYWVNHDTNGNQCPPSSVKLLFEKNSIGVGIWIDKIIMSHSKTEKNGWFYGDCTDSRDANTIHCF